MNPSPVLRQEILERLGGLSITARQAVESVLSGQHRSIRRGLSVEFATHRPYLAGDDLRHLDWFVYARSDRFDVRVYEEETRLRATVVLDVSGSMQFGSPSKFEYARSLAAALSFLMLRQNDSVGLALFDTTLRAHLPVRSNMSHLLTLVDAMAGAVPGGETSIGEVLMLLGARLRRRGVVILVTDGFDQADSFLMALNYLRHRKQEVRLFQVIDPQEETFPFNGMVEFWGMENEPRLKVDGDRLRRRYQEALAGHQARLAEGCHALGIQRHVCRTDQDLAQALVAALADHSRPTARQ